MNLWSLNSCSGSYIISISRVFLNKSVIDIARLLLYCGSVTYLRVKTLYFPLYNIVGFKIFIGFIRYTKGLFCGISSDTLADNLPYFKFDLLYVGKCHNY